MSKWVEGSNKWHYLVDDDGEVVGSISAYSYPFCCYIKGASAGQYDTLELAKKKLVEKCQKKKLVGRYPL